MTPGQKPEPPAIRLEQREDLTPAGQTGFLRLVRRRFIAHYPDGSLSQPFVYDEVDRAALDAVVIVAHYLERGSRFVYLRSAVRPPVACREAPGAPHGLWELPAGLVEPAEAESDAQASGRRPSAGLPDGQVSGRRPSAGLPDGARRTAQREAEEELGFSLPIERFHELGPWLFPAPGIIAERHYYFEVEVDPSVRAEPSHDGSPLEHFGKVIALELEHALTLCLSGDINDSKTELGLRRLREKPR
jgi:ADP-ribose pyrophosphatase